MKLHRNSFTCQRLQHLNVRTIFKNRPVQQRYVDGQTKNNIILRCRAAQASPSRKPAQECCYHDFQASRLGPQLTSCFLRHWTILLALGSRCCVCVFILRSVGGLGEVEMASRFGKGSLTGPCISRRDDVFRFVQPNLEHDRIYDW